MLNILLVSRVQGSKYRTDIDGLRAIAVLTVIAFHFGILSNGFLGVDVFFVISGFLITGIIYKEFNENRFSIVEFYIRRIRRIIPLALFVSLMALVIGILTMLPDDLENLAQSVVATNFISNNILQAITTKDYWDVVNEYKPLMHTWSLGVEEQFYLVYPFLLMLVMKKRPRWLLPIVAAFALSSLTLYLLPYFSEAEKFYLLFFRFWELAAGGVVAIALRNKLVSHRYSVVLISLLVILMVFNFPFIPSEVALLLVVALTMALLATSTNSNSFGSVLLENRVLVAIGKISFSLYMWHQVLLAYARYAWAPDLGVAHLTLIFLLTVVLSTFSYFLIEQPFRNKKKVNTKVLFLTLGFVFSVSSVSSLYINMKGGVLRDVPELEMYKGDVGLNIHKKYNHSVYQLDKPFTSTERLKVLVLGNSFARDWVNVLLESTFSDTLEISYIYLPSAHKDLGARAEDANVIFYSTPIKSDVQAIGLPESKLWAIGTKNFGTSNGIFYNRKGADYFKQRTEIEEGYLEINSSLAAVWGDRYIDLIGKVIDQDMTMPVFTPSDKFISQDNRHFTIAGARFYSQLFEGELKHLFSSLE